MALVLALVASSARGDEWRYVVPEPRGEHEHPPLRALSLSRQKPDNLSETTRYRGRERQYAELVFGSHGSTRVVVVVDRRADGEADLYVDTQRNRIIEPRDRVEPEEDGRTWRLPLDVAVVEEDETVKLTRRSVIFQLGRSGRTLSVAACGYLAGEVDLDGRRVRARRMDGDGDGFFAGPQDRLWLDLDGDGRWDPLQEQFLFVPVLRIGETRYAVRSDAVGERLALEKLEGSGTVRLLLDRAGSRAAAGRIDNPSPVGLVEFTATLLGRDGSVFSLRHSEPEVALPIGEYRLSTLTVSLKDPVGGPNWRYVFSDRGGRTPHTWYRVARGNMVEIDPVGELKLATGVAEATTCRPGDEIPAQPRLYTGDGLLVNTVERQRSATSGGHNSCSARIALTTADGTFLTAGSSGFA
ncbi:MAG TPA: hypothetical protein VML55_09615 [Planctomycetaceae bacterium]|nr:hypothetical protein [Planctomycetaceae bacterium]